MVATELNTKTQDRLIVASRLIGQVNQAMARLIVRAVKRDKRICRRQARLYVRGARLTSEYATFLKELSLA